MPENLEITDESRHIASDGSVLPGNPGEEEVLTVRDGQAVVVPRRALAAPPAPAPAPAQPAEPPAPRPRPAWLDRGRGEVFDRKAAERTQLAAEAVGDDDPAGQAAGDVIHQARYDRESPLYRALNALDPNPRHEEEAIDRLLDAYRVLEPDNTVIARVGGETPEETAERARAEQGEREATARTAWVELETTARVRDDGLVVLPEVRMPALAFAQAQGFAPAEAAGLEATILTAEHEPLLDEEDLRREWGPRYEEKSARVDQLLAALVAKYPEAQRPAVQRALSKRSVLLRLDRILDRRAATEDRP